MFCEYLAKPREVYVPARDNTYDFSSAGFACQGASERTGSGTLCDNTVAFSHESYCRFNFIQFCNEGTSNQPLRALEHLRKYNPGADAIH